MSFTIRNKTAGPPVAVELKDLGLTLAASADLSLLSESPADIQNSADLLAAIAAGFIVVLDPLDGVELSIADSTAAVTNANDPHFVLNDSNIRVVVEDSTASFNDLRAANTRQWSAGVIDSISVTDGGAGTVDVAAGEAFFHTAATETSSIELASWPSVTSLALTDNVTQIVYADYNSGSPVVAVTTDLTVDGTGVINNLDTIPLAFVDRDGTTVVIYEATTINNISDKIIQRLIDAEGLTHTQGVGTLILDLGSQKIGLTSGSFWLGLLKIPHTAFDTSVADTFQYWRRDGSGGWIEEAAAETDWDNLQYDTDPGLATLTDKRYTNVWVYLEMGNPTSELHVIYGTSNEKNVTDALAEDIPGIGSSLPPPLQRLGIFVGRFVVKKSDTSSTVIDSPFHNPGGAGGGTQNLWESIASDAGSTTADSPTDTLTIAGAGTVSTSIAGDTITITGAGGGGAQNIIQVSVSAGTDDSAETHYEFDTTVFSEGADLSLSGTGSIDGLQIGKIYKLTAHLQLAPLIAPTGKDGVFRFVDLTGSAQIGEQWELVSQNLATGFSTMSGQEAFFIPSATSSVGVDFVSGTDGRMGKNSTFTVEEVTGSDGADGADGADGDPGPTGPAGSGTTINVYDEGIIVPSSPFSELNFIGASVTATDAGSGRTDITVTGGADELVKISANDTTAGFLGLKIVGATDEIVTAELNDAGDEDLEIGIADDVILPGDGSATMPTGTTGERPGAPVAGMLRFNETTSLMEFYNGTEWINLSGTSTGPGTVKGNILGYHFLLDKDIYNSWLGTTTKHIASNEVQYIMPFDGEIVALTYGCDIASSDVDAYIEFSLFGSGAANTTLFLWEIRDARVSHNSFAGESFTINFAGITGASLPTGVTPGAWFDVTASTSAMLFPGTTYRFWFSDGDTTVPATPAGGAVVAIPFTGAETAQAISDLVITAMVTTSGEADFANADNAGGTTTLVSCQLVFAGNVTDTEDGAVPTSAVFTVLQDGGPFGIIVNKGGKMGVFTQDPGGGTEPAEVVLSVFVQWINEPQISQTESYAADFTNP